MEFECRGTKEGKLDFGPYNRARFMQYLKDNGPLRLKITPELPESGKMRRFYEGAVVPLVCFYQHNFDHRNAEHRRQVREWMKEEFNGELVNINGIIHTVAKSTKGRAVLGPFVERVIDWLNDNYDVPAEALDPERYKTWRDTIFPYGGPDTYIDYLVSLNLLK